ncbi:hypothetical protein AAY473_009062 [Plecturocebus cupreus]
MQESEKHQVAVLLARLRCLSGQVAEEEVSRPQSCKWLLWGLQGTAQAPSYRKLSRAPMLGPVGFCIWQATWHYQLLTLWSPSHLGEDSWLASDR